MFEKASDEISIGMTPFEAAATNQVIRNYPKTRCLGLGWSPEAPIEDSVDGEAIEARRD